MYIDPRKIVTDVSRSDGSRKIATVREGADRVTGDFGRQTRGRLSSAPSWRNEEGSGRVRRKEPDERGLDFAMVLAWTPRCGLSKKACL